MSGEAERLVRALESLRDGEGAVTALVALGPPAVPPLRDFLLHGRPGTVFQPRQWAVLALGGLGARGVLMDYLVSPPPADPQIRFAEEAVRNTAVREFRRWPDAITRRFLLDLSETQMLAALAEIFGQMRTVEAIPFLDRALEDDVCRPAAEEALLALGAAARGPLIASAAIRLPSAETETPSSLRRRQSVLRVLKDTGIEVRDWPRLRPLLDEPDPEIAVGACVLAVRCGARDDAGAVVERLIGIAGCAPWFLLEDIASCLLAWRDEARSRMEAEIARRMRAPEAGRVQDQTLRLLLRVKRRAGENH